MEAPVSDGQFIISPLREEKMESPLLPPPAGTEDW